MTVTEYRGADVARCWAGLASLGAGLVHAAVVREHWSSALAHGVFFAVVAAGQIGWGIAALARDRVPLARRVAAANLGVVALWALTRTSEVPFGREAVGAADLGAVALELILVAAVVSPRWGFLRAPRRSVTGLVAGLAGGALVVGLITTPALAGTDAGANARPHLHHESVGPDGDATRHHHG
jgi:hypothetical protein